MFPGLASRTDGTNENRRCDERSGGKVKHLCLGFAVITRTTAEYPVRTDWQTPGPEYPEPVVSARPAGLHLLR